MYDMTILLHIRIIYTDDPKYEVHPVAGPSPSPPPPTEISPKSVQNMLFCVMIML